MSNRSLQKLLSFVNTPARKNFLIYGTGAFFLKGVSFFLIPLYTNLLSTAELGSYDLLRNFGTITEIVLSLGLLQLIYIEFFDQEKENRVRLLTTFISIYLVISTSCYIVLGAIIFMTSDSFLPGIKSSLVIMVLLTTYLNFFQVLLISVLKLSFQALRVSILQVVLGCTSLALNIILVYGLRKGIDGIIISSLVITILSCVYGTFYYYRQVAAFKISLNRVEISNYLRLSLPFIPNVLSFWIMNSANRWILLNYSGINEVGIFGVAARITAVFEPLLIEPFLSAYTPAVLQSLKDGKYRNDFYIRIAAIPLVFLFFGFLLQVAGKFVIGPEFIQSLQLMIPLAIAYSFNMVAQTSSVILIHKKLVRSMLICVVTGSVISIVLNFTLVPGYGASGSAWGIAGGNAAWALLVALMARNEIRKFRVFNNVSGN